MTTQFKSNVPHIGVSVNINSVQIIPSVNSIQLAGNSLTATLLDRLTEDEHEKLSKEIRVLYGFCFEHVYSEDFAIYTAKTHYEYFGHNERKEHLLAENSPVSENFGKTCTQLLEDIVSLRPSQAKRRAFFNAAFIWVRANELKELKLMSEAYTQYWRLLDWIYKKSQLSTPQVHQLLDKYELEYTESNRFSIRILNEMGMLKPRKSSNIQYLAFLDSLRHPHAHQPNARANYYMEESTHLESWLNNIFISDITKLFIIWQLGLKEYHLKPRANIYELAKRQSNSQ